MIQCETFLQRLIFVNWEKTKNSHQYSKRLGLIYEKKTEFMKELNLVVSIPHLYMKHQNYIYNFANQWINSFILQGFYFPNYRKHFFARISFHKWEDNSRNLRKSPPRKFSPYKVSSVLKRKKIAGLRL